MSSVSVPLPGRFDYPTISAGSTIGSTGNTGLDPNNPEQGIHLDLSVFYVSGRYTGGNLGRTYDPEPDRHGLTNGVGNFFGIFLSPEGDTEINYGKIEVIDPVTLWPILAEGISDSIDYNCQ